MSKRRKIMCGECRTIFTTTSSKRHKCTKCQPPKKEKVKVHHKPVRKKWKPTLGTALEKVLPV